MFHYHKQNDTRYKAPWTSELSVGKLVESAVTSPFIHPVEGLLEKFHQRNGQSYEHDEYARQPYEVFCLKQPIKNVLLPCWWLCQVVVGLTSHNAEMLVVNYSQTGLITRDKGENQNKQTAETVEFTAYKVVNGTWNSSVKKIVLLVLKRWSLRHFVTYVP